MLAQRPLESGFGWPEVRLRQSPSCLSTALLRTAFGGACLAAERFGLPRIEDDRVFTRFAKHVVAVDQ